MHPNQRPSEFVSERFFLIHPEGWFTIGLGNIRGYCARTEFIRQPGPGPGSVRLSRLPPEDKIIATVKARITLAYNGDPPEQLAEFHRVLTDFRAGKKTQPDA